MAIKSTLNGDWKKKSYITYSMGEHIHFQAVIEMSVCASDGATGWQDGGPSLTGKPEQEEQTPY